MSMVTFVVVVQLSLIFIGFFAYILARLCDRLLTLWILKSFRALVRPLAPAAVHRRLWLSSQQRLPKSRSSYPCAKPFLQRLP
ncbi:MAG: hypothetical protein ACMZI2_07575 (plasmid) [Candidatus Symbiodolus clandestinus]